MFLLALLYESLALGSVQTVRTLNDCPGNVRSEYDGEVTLTSCSFDKIINGSSSVMGGAIYLKQGGKMKIESCNFTDIIISGAFSSGGAIYAFKSSTEYINTKFTNCSSSSKGGAIFNNKCSNTTITDCSFLKCSSNAASGCKIQYDHDTEVPLRDSVDFKSTSFIECFHADAGDSDDFCTLALDFDGESTIIQANLINCTFKDLKEFAILCECSIFSLNNSAFSNVVNLQQDHSSCLHCLLKSISTGFYYISGTTFDKCITQDYGVMNIPNVALSMQNCNITNCIANDTDNVNAHGVMITDSDVKLEEVSIKNCIFADNDCSNGGSGLYVDRAKVNLNLDYCVFSSNKVSNSKGSAYGANIHSKSSGTITIQNTQFHYIKVNDATSVVFQGTPSNVTIISSCFNSTGSYSNNTYHIISSVKITFDKVCVNRIKNQFSFAPGQSYAGIDFNCDQCQPFDTCPTVTERFEKHRSDFRLLKCNFHDIIIDDNSINDGGALFLGAGTFYIRECTFIHIYLESTSAYGGAIRFGDGTVIVKYCNFYDCKATTAGGAIYNEAPIATDIEYCDFQYCLSKNASAIRIEYGNAGPAYYGTTVSINYCTFKHLNMTDISTDKDNNDYYCSLSLDFPGIGLEEPATAKINNCVFQEIDEFAILLEITTVELINTYFNLVKNPIENHASCVHCLTQTINAHGHYIIRNTTFDSCTTNDFGVMNIPFVNLTMEDCAFKSCVAYDKEGKDAHTLMITDDSSGGRSEDTYIVNCQFSRCKSSNGGAGIFIDRPGKTIIMEKCVFEDCDVTDRTKENVGINLHVINNGTIFLTECVFKAKRNNFADKTTNLYFNRLTEIGMEYCTIETLNYGGTANKSSAVFHIISDVTITFDGYNCYNKIGDGARDFSFTPPTGVKSLSSNCQDNMPKDECQNSRFNVKDDFLNLYGCNFNNIKSITVDTTGGAICVISEKVLCRMQIQKCNFQDIDNTQGGSCGGAIYTFMVINTIKDCTFDNCKAKQYGGACDFEHPKANEVVNSQFVSCVADHCSAIKFNFNARKDNPGKDDLNGEAHITGCDFFDCYSLDVKTDTDYSCALALDYVDSDDNTVEVNATIIDSTFIGFEPTFAILSECKYMIILNTQFLDINNDIEGKASCIYCLTGSISTGNYIFHNLLFSRCNSKDYGVVNIPNVGLDMKDCYFSSLISKDEDNNYEAHGFMITDNDDILNPVVIENCYFNLVTTGNGGALFIDRKEKDVLILNCEFSNCYVIDSLKANYGANIQVVNNGSIAIVGCKFQYYLSNTRSASVAIYDVYKCIFFRCCFESYGEFSSAGHIRSNVKVDFYPDNCFNDLGQYNFEWTGEKPDLSNVHFNCEECLPVTECKSERIEMTGVLVNIRKCAFANIISNELDGGAVCCYNGRLMVNDCSFINCSAESAGAVFAGSSSTEISNSIFLGNAASHEGGCVYLYQPNISTITDSTFSKSKAQFVGALYINGKPDYDADNDFEEIPTVTVITRCQFNDDIATTTSQQSLDHHCIVSLTFTDFKTVLNATFANCVIRNSDNTYKSYGIFCKATYLTLNNTLFYKCTNIDAEGRASCVYCPPEAVHFGHYWLYNTTFLECETTDYGVMNVPNVQLSMINSIVKRCFSYDADEKKNAHGFMITDDDNYLQTVNINNCTFEETKSANGGALFVDRSYKDVHVENCKFINNVYDYDTEANVNGGGANLHVVGSGNLYLSYCEFTYIKKNGASSVKFDGLTKINIYYCCFKSQPQVAQLKFNTSFNIWSNTKIDFEGDICMRNNTANGINNRFESGQDEKLIVFNCDSSCIPVEECSKNERTEYVSKKINLNGCKHESPKIPTGTTEGGIIFGSMSYIILNSCTFDSALIKNTPSSKGGACFLQGCVSIIKDCEFLYNSASQGGALFIFYPISSYCDNCFFDGNSASEKSAAVYLERSITSWGKAKNLKSADWYPEESDSSDVYQFINCVFQDNDVDRNASPDLGDYRCVLSLDYMGEANANFTAVIKGCSFTTTANTFAILCESGYLEMVESSFNGIKCDIQDHSSVLHTILDSVAEGKYIIYNVTCVGCDTQDFGLMNIPNVIVDMKDCYFRDCEADDSDNHKDGHGIMLTDTDAKLLDVNIENVSFIALSSNGGGALYINRATVKAVVKNCLFRSNAVKNTQAIHVGANIHLEGSKSGSFTLSGCKLDFDKKVNGTSSLYVNQTATSFSFYLEKCCFNSNAIPNLDESAIHIFSNHEFYIGVDNCFNHIQGNLIDVPDLSPSDERLNYDCDEDCIPIEICTYQRIDKSDLRVNVQNCSFRDLTIGPDQNGCAISVRNGILIVKYTVFSNVNGATEGGAIYTHNSEMRISYTRFIKCVSTTSGGAIMGSYTNYSLVQNCQFSMCSSQRGSAVWLFILPDDDKNNDNDLTEIPKNASIIGCTFRDCTHSSKPQEGYIDYYCTLAVDFEDTFTVADLVVTDTTFQDNTGFGMLSEASYMTIKNVLFKRINNDQQGHSSCIHCLAETVYFGLFTLHNVTFSECKTEDYGVMNVPNVGLDMDNCTISYCTALDSDEHINAHGFMITDYDVQLFPVKIKNCLFEYNEGANGGGGLYIDRAYKDVTIESCQFRYNSASYSANSAKYGANIQAVNNGKVAITGCTFLFQKSNDAASILFDSLDSVILTNNCFTSSSWSDYSSAFHIVSDKMVTFVGVQCFNNKTGMVMFKLPDGQKYVGVATNCDQYCTPLSECPDKRIPIVDFDDLNIKNCNFKDIIYSELEGNGGAVIYLNNIGFICRECTFTNITATNTSGGALYISYGKVLIHDCSFTKCKSGNDGGAIFSDSPAETLVENTLFEECDAPKVSTVHFIYQYYVFYPTDLTSVFKGCIVRKIPYNTGTSKDYDCCIAVDINNDNNPDDDNDNDYIQDGFYINATLIDCYFINNDKFAFFTEAANLTVINTAFKNINYNEEDQQNHSVCIHCQLDLINYGKYYFKNVTFISCYSNDFGVMNIPNVALEMYDCLIHNVDVTDTESKDSHGLMITDNDNQPQPVSIYNTEFSLVNTINGGAVFIDKQDCNVWIVNCTFNENGIYGTQNDNYLGVNIMAAGSRGTLNLNGCIINYEKTKDYPSIGVKGSTSVFIESCCFYAEVLSETNLNGVHIKSDGKVQFNKNNCYTEHDNAFNITGFKNPGEPYLYTNCHECQPVIDCSMIDFDKMHNLVDTQVYVYQCALRGFIDMEIKGGFMYAERTTVKIEACIFVICKAYDGAAVYLHESALNMTDCYISGTEAESSAAIFTNYPISTEFTGCNFTQCTARYGSAIRVRFVIDDSPDNDEEEVPQNATITRCQFTQCSIKNPEEANDNGCIISLDTEGESTVMSGEFINCSIQNCNTFGILSELSYLRIENALFDKIVAKMQGHSSAVHCLSESVHFGYYYIINTVFSDLITQDYGVMNVPNVALDMDNVTMKDCYSYDEDQHKDAHGFMITDDDDLLLDISIQNCVFKNNEAQNGGAGLFIDRIAKYVYIIRCEFMMNKATYNDNAENYGANLQVVNGGFISLMESKFNFEKTNKASNILFKGLDQIYIASCCFKSTGEGVENTPFHINSDSTIYFNGYSCFNDMNDNFKFANNQDQKYISFKCEDFCIPVDTCPSTKHESYGQNLVLYRCSFENFGGTSDNQQGGVIRMTGGTLIIDSCSFTSCKLTGTGSCGGAMYLDYSTSNITNCKFIRCECKRTGGALDIEWPNNVLFRNNIFSYCVATRASGTKINYATFGDNPYPVIYSVEIESCTFKDCSHHSIDDADYYCALALDFDGTTAIVNGTINNCVFKDLKGFGVLSECSYMTLTNTIFQNIINDQQNHCSCVHCLVKSISNGQYTLKNSTFVECVTEDFGVFNMPNVGIDMQDCQVLRCVSKDSDRHVDAHGFMITDDDGIFSVNVIKNCVFEANEAANGGAGLFIDRVGVKIDIIGCKFLRNKATYADNSKDYGINVHIVGISSIVYFELCKFVTTKENDATSFRYEGNSGNLRMNYTCFTTTGDGFKSPYHIYSGISIFFSGTNCFNDMGEYNFKFQRPSSNSTFSFECADNCLPYSYCPIMSRYPNSTNTLVNLVHCDIIGFSVSGPPEGINGGALYCQNCRVYITSCTFQNCGAKGDGGAVYLKMGSTLEVIDSKFTACTSGEKGGAIYDSYPKSASFQDCMFIRNTASHSSAVKIAVPPDSDKESDIDDKFSISFTNCLFKENIANGKDQSGLCALNVDDSSNSAEITTIMRYCRFLDMQSYGMFSENSFLTLEHCIFQNLNNSLCQGRASGIHCDISTVAYGEYVILNTTFIGLISDDYGVMNVPNVALKMNQVTVKNCKSYDANDHKNAHGFMITDSDEAIFPVVVQNCVFESNDAANGGAGLHIDRNRKEITIVDCQFLNNVASYEAGSDKYGINLQVYGNGFINVTKCKFVCKKENKAVSVRFENLTRIIMDSCCFKTTGTKTDSGAYHIYSNTRINFYGTLCANKNTPMFELAQDDPKVSTDCDDNCIPNVECPSQRKEYSKVIANIQKCTFNKLISTGMGVNGGAIKVNDGILYVLDCYFSECQVTGMSSNGGAIYCLRTEIHVYDSRFATCTSYTRGGAVENVFPNITEFKNCIFARCSSKRASAIHADIYPDYNEDDDEFEIPQEATFIGCNFRENYHGSPTGEGYEDYYCTVSIDFDQEFTALKAIFKDTIFWGSKEFAILSEASDLTLENTVFMGITNDIQGHASCVHCLTETVHIGTYIIKNTSFINCVTEDFGVMNVPNVALNMSDVTVIGCNSTDSDEHLHAHGFMITDNDDNLLPIYITNCVFESNDAANGGAGLYIDRKAKNIIITGCVFRNNKVSYTPDASRYGVNLQVEGTGKITLIQCKLIFNKANDACNAKFNGLDEIILENNCFISNGNGNTPFHIVSDKIITFIGLQHCFNQKGNYNFQFASGQIIPDTVKFTCDEFCVPADQCPSGRVTKEDSVLNLVRCTFSGTRTDLDGSVAFLFDSVLNIIDSTFNDCYANNNGGVIRAMGGEIHIYNSRFNRCEGRLYAGAIYGIGQTIYIIDGCTFNKCKSKKVNTIMISFQPDFEPGNDEEEIPQNASVLNCQFIEGITTDANKNFLDTYCVMSMDFNLESTVANASIINCSFNQNIGFGILSELTYMQLINTTFYKQNNDKAGNHASCVHCLTETVHFGAYTIKNTTFSECVTDDYGVMNVPNVILDMRDCLVSKCTSTDVDGNISGHGFMITDDDDLLELITVINCVFEENNCANGGALYINRKLKNVIVENCQFTNNRATFEAKAEDYGANLQIEGTGTITLNNCKFVFDKTNKATSIRLQGLDKIIMSECCFKTTATSKEGYFHIWADTMIAFMNFACFNSITGVASESLSHFVNNQFTDEFSYNCDDYCIPITECPPISIEMYLQGTLNIAGCNFVDMAASIIATISGKLIIRNTKFQPKQTASTKGYAGASAIWAKYTDLYVYDCEFIKCVVGESAGAVGTILSNITHFERCTFTECANKLVAAVYLNMIEDDDASNDEEEIPKLGNFTDCTFTKCSHPSFDKDNAKFYCTIAAYTETTTTVVSLILTNCRFEDIQGFGVMTTASFLTMDNTVFKNVKQEQQDYASCVHCPPENVHFGTYTLKNTQFDNCSTQDYGVMNVPNVGLYMTKCTVKDCSALDSDQSVNGHGFMITDNDDLLYPCFIDSCTFEGNDGANGGAGLYIDRKQKSIFITNCQFSNNKASHDEGSHDYGVNLQVIGTGVISLYKCTFNFVKTNKAASTLFYNLNQINIDSCTFNSEGSGDTPFHIIADTIITFKGTNCMNNKGNLNFKFADGQTTDGVKFNCGSDDGDDGSQGGGGSGSLSSGALAGVIIAVVLIIAIALVVIVIFLVKKGVIVRKKNEDSDVYHADKEVSYSEAMSTATFETANAEHVFDDEL